MSCHDPDAEDWYDHDEELDEEQSARCPECGAAVHRVADHCPSCGYWLSEADRRAMWSSMDKPRWLKVTAMIVLVAFLLSVLGIAAAMF